MSGGDPQTPADTATDDLFLLGPLAYLIGAVAAAGAAALVLLAPRVGIPDVR